MSAGQQKRWAERGLRPKDLLNSLLLSLGATGLRYLFNPALGFRSPLLFHILAVAIAAEIGGTSSGAATTGLSFFLIDYFFIPGTKFRGDWLALGLFVVVGGVLSVFCGKQKVYRDRLKLAHERLALKHEVARMGTFDWFPLQGDVVWTPEMEKIYGISSHDHVHTIEEWKHHVHPEDVVEALAALENAPRNQLPVYDSTFRIIRPDGQVRWIHSRRKYQYDAQGRAIHVMGINIDVTELKEGEMAQKILGGLLQVCSSCRRIRDRETQQWYSMEAYLRRHSSARFSHGMCTDCGQQWLAQEETK
jgi:PAS domain S-box-containing protein